MYRPSADAVVFCVRTVCSYLDIYYVKYYLALVRIIA